MPLPVLRNASSSSPADFIRLFHQSQLEWSRHLGEETELDFGRWICNTNLPDSDEANCLLDAYLIPGTSPSQLLAEMNDRCQKAGTPWRRCSINPSAPIEQTAPLIEALQTAGWKPTPTEILYKKKGDGDLFPPRDQNKGDGDLFSLPNLTVIPSRASYRHYRELMDKREAGSADIALMHLDDSHVDSLLALRGGEPVGCISILTTGEVGTVREWFVASNHRREGIGCQLLDRALEICARGLLRHVMIGVPNATDQLRKLCAVRGFVSIGTWVAFSRPSNEHVPVP